MTEGDLLKQSQDLLRYNLGEDALKEMGTASRDALILRANEVILRNAKAEGAKVARVASGGACQHCFMLASLGAVYSADTALAPGHPHCTCSVVAVRDGETFTPSQRALDWEGMDDTERRREAGGPGTRGNPKSTVEAKAAATSLLSRAAAAEPAQTKTMRRIASQTGGELAGLDYRLKGLDSLTRKISQDMMDRGGARRKPPTGSKTRCATP
jgi:hypothetical protein